jgi:hypothetical protein
MSTIDPDLVRLLKRLKLGPLLPTLPERLTLARAQQLDYTAFLTLLLADEVQRRDQQALERHLVQAGFEDRVTLDGFDWTSPVQLDRRQLQQVFTLEFLARTEHVVFVGPVRTGTRRLCFLHSTAWRFDGRLEWAARTLGAADELYASIAHASARNPHDPPAHAQLRMRLEMALGRTGFARLRAEGAPSRSTK